MVSLTFYFSFYKHSKTECINLSYSLMNFYNMNTNGGWPATRAKSRHHQPPTPKALLTLLAGPYPFPKCSCYSAGWPVPEHLVGVCTIVRRTLIIREAQRVNLEVTQLNLTFKLFCFHCHISVAARFGADLPKCLGLLFKRFLSPILSLQN